LLDLEEERIVSFNESMVEYRKQLEKGTIQKAYQGLMDYMMGLRSNFEKKYPDYSISGSLYFGYMDMTYFSFFPNSLKRQGLKVGVVFIHKIFVFEIWLFGYNKSVQAKYWKLFKENGYNLFQIPSDTKGVDYILKDILVENPDFNNLDDLTEQIENGTLKFIENVERFLSKMDRDEKWKKQ
jgi:hypothetical protein